MLDTHEVGEAHIKAAGCCLLGARLCLEEQISVTPGELLQGLPDTEPRTKPQGRERNNQHTKNSKQIFKNSRLNSTTQYFPQLVHEMNGNAPILMNNNHYPQ